MKQSEQLCPNFPWFASRTKFWFWNQKKTYENVRFLKQPGYCTTKTVPIQFLCFCFLSWQKIANFQFFHNSALYTDFRAFTPNYHEIDEDIHQKKAEYPLVIHCLGSSLV